MSKIVYAYFKNAELVAGYENKIRSICDKLVPDNFRPFPSKIFKTRNILYGIINPVDSILEKDNSVLLGLLIDNSTKWWEPNSDSPDGSFAIFRESNDIVELVSDAVGSRTIWYYKDTEKFIASTSQRAIVMMLSTFKFDDRVIPWILSTGSLGPSFSWDKRIERVPPDSSVILDKRTWTYNVKTNVNEFEPIDVSDKKHEEIIKNILIETFESFRPDFSKWVLPLSGGYDSRGVLCLFDITKNLKDIRTITWGVETAINEKGNDAYVAKRLAECFQIPHKYYHTDLSDEHVERVINRFLIAGEGRIDHISGYMDGFKLWKLLFEDGVRGIIRGDQGFGERLISSPLTVRMRNGIALCTDFSNLKSFQEYGIKQEIPSDLLQRENETLEMWRDRLRHEYRIPTILAALSDLKFPYVEQSIPLLSKKILLQVKKLPDHLRTDKILFKKIVTSMSPKIEFAKSKADSPRESILKNKEIVSLLRDELSSNNIKSIIPDNFISYLLKNISQENNSNQKKNKSLKTIIKKSMPPIIKNMIRDKVTLQSIDPNILAFRVYLISKMEQMLSGDVLSK